MYNSSALSEFECCGFKGRGTMCQFVMKWPQQITIRSGVAMEEILKSYRDIETKQRFVNGSTVLHKCLCKR